MAHGIDIKGHHNASSVMVHSHVALAQARLISRAAGALEHRDYGVWLAEGCEDTLVNDSHHQSTS